MAEQRKIFEMEKNERLEAFKRRDEERRRRDENMRKQWAKEEEEIERGLRDRKKYNREEINRKPEARD